MMNLWLFFIELCSNICCWQHICNFPTHYSVHAALGFFHDRLLESIEKIVILIYVVKFLSCK